MSTERQPTAGGPGLEALRADFPILRRPVRDGRPLVYLDNAATTQKPDAVIEAVASYYREINANVHRAIHRLAELATEAYEEARRKIAAFVRAPDERGVIFTRGTTEAVNLVAYAWGGRHLREGDAILLSEMEHHSNLVPWQMLARRTGAELRYIPVTEAGELDLEGFRARLTPAVKLVAVTHMSNVLGTVNPVQSLARAARESGARVLVDAAQSVPHMPVDFTAIGCDFMAFSGHKMCGPTGIGALVARPDVLDEMDPFLGGGEMINRVTWEHATWAEPPHKFEAGTPDISGAIGLGAAVDYLTRAGMDAIQRHVAELTRYALDALAAVPGLAIHGRAAERGGAISFSLDGVHPHDVAHFVDRDGIAIRAGHMCAQPLMKKRGVNALSRASLYFYNTRPEIDALARSLKSVQEFFARATG